MAVSEIAAWPTHIQAMDELEWSWSLKLVHVQADQSGCSLGVVDIGTKVALEH